MAVVQGWLRVFKRGSTVHNIYNTPQTIREQYPDDQYNLSIQSVKFSSEDGIDDLAIGINFRKELGGWFFGLRGGDDKKIYRSEVCFWDEYPTPLYLKEMCEEKLYPPRFSVLVRGPVRLDDVVKAEFTFPGAEVFPGGGEPLATIYLPLPAQRSSVSTGSVTSEAASRAPAITINSPSTVQSLQPAAQAFKACMCDLDDLHPSKLALNLVSNDLIDDTYFESVQESMRSATRDEMVIRNEILWKVYSALKADATLHTPLQRVLNKLSPLTAGIFESEMRRLSSGDTSTASITATPQENLSHESVAAESDVFSESVPDPVVHPGPSSALTVYSPMQFPENLPGLISFNSLASSHIQPLTHSELSYPSEESHPEET